MRRGVPGFGAGDGCDGQGGDPVGPPPAQRVIQRQGGQREQAGGRSPVITETTPDRAPNATETETSHSARVTMRSLVPSLSSGWPGSIRFLASFCAGLATQTLRAVAGGGGLLADFRCDGDG
jgi:hypothetical protein